MFVDGFDWILVVNKSGAVHARFVIICSRSGFLRLEKGTSELSKSSDHPSPITHTHTHTQTTTTAALS